MMAVLFEELWTGRGPRENTLPFGVRKDSQEESQNDYSEAPGSVIQVF
jgi:hypothetical protein